MKEEIFIEKRLKAAVQAMTFGLATAGELRLSRGGSAKGGSSNANAAQSGEKAAEEEKEKASGQVAPRKRMFHSIIDDIFGGVTMSEIICSQCGNVRLVPMFFFVASFSFFLLFVLFMFIVYLFMCVCVCVCLFVCVFVCVFVCLFAIVTPALWIMAR
jgi:hypothetical protein